MDKGNVCLPLLSNGGSVSPLRRAFSTNPLTRNFLRVWSGPSFRVSIVTSDTRHGPTYGHFTISVDVGPHPVLPLSSFLPRLHSPSRSPPEVWVGVSHPDRTLVTGNSPTDSLLVAPTIAPFGSGPQSPWTPGLVCRRRADPV